jgi:hypothetical protein
MIYVQFCSQNVLTCFMVLVDLGHKRRDTMPYPDNYNSRTAPDGFEAGRRADAAESAANEYYEDHRESIDRAVAIARGFFESLSSTTGHMGQIERSSFAQSIQEAIIESLDLDTNAPDGFNDAYSIANDQVHDMRRAAFGPSTWDIGLRQINAKIDCNFDQASVASMLGLAAQVAI